MQLRVVLEEGYRVVISESTYSHFATSETGRNRELLVGVIGTSHFYPELILKFLIGLFS